MRIKLGAVATVLALAVSGYAYAGGPIDSVCDPYSVTKWDEHPLGAPPGLVDYNTGLKDNTATPGGNVLLDSVCQDTGGGNGSDSGDPGNVANVVGGPNGAPSLNDD